MKCWCPHIKRGEFCVFMALARWTNVIIFDKTGDEPNFSYYKHELEI